MAQRRYVQRCFATGRGTEGLAFHPDEGGINLFSLKADREQLFDEIIFRHHVTVIEEILGDEADNRQDPFSQAVSIVAFGVLMGAAAPNVATTWQLLCIVLKL